MEDRDKPSWLITTFGPLIFVLGAFAALLYFFYSTLLLIEGISSDIVILEKGAFYTLGVGVGLMAIAYAGVQETWLRKPLTPKCSATISKLAIAGILLTFSVPHLIHYLSNSYLQKSGYSVCEAASHQWLFVRNIVYIQHTVECNEELNSDRLVNKD